MADEAANPGARPAAFPAEHPLEPVSASLSVHSSPPSMPEETPQPNPHPSRWKRRVTLASLLVVLLAAAVVLPPLINISRYQRSITALIARSLGRSVHLSSVGLRLLPRPGFVLHSLSVSEDAEFGAEPILSADTVIASIRLGSLWRGHVEIDRISVDGASVNLVRSQRGVWNLQSLMMGGLMDGARGADGSNPAGTQPASPRKPAPFPYLEAINSRVNLKNGLEKSPFSLANTQLSLWQDTPGTWRLRLRGQPVRTDMEISLADTGEVQVEATMQTSSPAHELRNMPLKLQAEWREAQLGQLSRLVLGSDAGWRGDLTADIDVQGTLDAAQTKTRLRATSVRRQEFAPATPLDFDANCNFRYEHAHKALRDVGCDTAVGGGLLHLKADLPGDAGRPEAMLEVRKLPLQAGLDLLRTLRSGFAPGITAEGAADGTLSLMPTPPETKSSARHGARSKRPPRPSPSPGKAGSIDAGAIPLSLQGSLAVTGGLLRGGALKQPLSLPKITWTPTLLTPAQSPGNSLPSGLAARFTVALGPTPAPAPASSSAPPALPAAPAPTPASPALPDASTPATPTPATPDTAEPKSTKPPAPLPSSRAQDSRAQDLTVHLTLTAQGYDAAIGGTASIAKLRDLAYAFGAPHSDAADSFSAGNADLNLTATGPWIASADNPLLAQTLAASGTPPETDRRPIDGPPTDGPPAPGPDSLSGSDRLSGSLQLHHAAWTTPYLARPVDLPQATITLAEASTSMTSEFDYGALKGSMTVHLPVHCNTPACPPELQLHLGTVDAMEIEGALLGAPEKKTLLSPLIDRMRSSGRPKWPAVAVTVQADSLTLGSATLRKPLIHIKMDGAEMILESWEAALLGGAAKGAGHLSWVDDGPQYTLEGSFTGISPAALAALATGAGAHSEDDPSDASPSSAPPATWTGGPLHGSGAIQLTGLTGKQLASSTTGTVHFNWPHGSLPSSPASKEAPQTEVRFDDWSGSVTLAGGKAQLSENLMRQGKHTASMAGAIPFGAPAHLTLAPPAGKTPLNPNQTKPAAPPVQ